MTVYGALGEVTDARWQAVADRFELGRVRRAVPLTQGLFGKNVELECDSGRWVFRGMHWDEVFHRERYFAQQIAERTSLGAPWPYEIDSSCELFDWTYAVMRHVGGDVVVLEETRDVMPVADALGRAAAELHAITFGAPAGFVDDALVDFEGTQSEWFEVRLAGWLYRIAEFEPLDATSERFVLDAGAEARVEGYEPTMVHHDLTVGNTTYRSIGEAREVVGVFDLQEAFVGDPDEDIVRSLWILGRRDREAARTFLAAYRDRRPARDGQRERLWAYAVADMLVIWEFGRRDGRDWFGAHERFKPWARERLEPLLELI